jgi:anti-sigma B factor antagonist
LHFGPGVNELHEVAQSAIDNGTANLVLNLSEMPAIDSSGIGEIVWELKTAKQAGGTVKLVSPSKFAAQTFKLVRITKLFDTYDDEQQALESLES